MGTKRAREQIPVPILVCFLTTDVAKKGRMQIPVGTGICFLGNNETKQSTEVNPSANLGLIFESGGNIEGQMQLLVGTGI